MIVRRLRFVFAAAVALTGCNALLDVKDIYLDPSAEAGGPVVPDGSSEGSVSPEGSTGDDGGVDATPCTANVQIDAKNCGRCGHDCLGGGCTTGKCDAVVLAASLTNPSGVAVGPDAVYFTTYGSGTVTTVKKSGGATAALVMQEKRARGVAVTADTLYWANGDFAFDDAGAYGGIWKCTLPGCTARKLVAPGGYDTAYPVLHDGAVYFGAGEENSVSRVVAGDPVVVANVTRPFGIAVDDTHVYYTSQETLAYRARIDKTGGPETIGPTGDAAGFIAVDDQRVYWAYTSADGTGHVVSVAKAALNGGTVQYGSDADNVRAVGIAIDADNVYWSTAGHSSASNAPVGDGKVFTCKKTGCGGAPPTVLATGNMFAGQLVVDTEAVYWAEYGTENEANGRIRKIAKP